MKYNGLKSSYGYVHNERGLFSLGDILTIAKYINKNEREIYISSRNTEILQGINKYYTKLGESILKGIGSKYTIKNYVNMTFETDVFLMHRKERAYIGLLKIRNSYLDVLHCFSNHHVGSPWRNIEKCDNFEKMNDEVIFYKDSLATYKEHVINISNLIGRELGEDIDKYVSIRDLKESYGFDVNFDEIQENYFRL